MRTRSVAHGYLKARTAFESALSGDTSFHEAGQLVAPLLEADPYGPASVMLTARCLAHAGEFALADDVSPGLRSLTRRIFVAIIS